MRIKCYNGMKALRELLKIDGMRIVQRAQG